MVIRTEWAREEKEWKEQDKGTIMCPHQCFITSRWCKATYVHHHPFSFSFPGILSILAPSILQKLPAFPCSSKQHVHTFTHPYNINTSDHCLSNMLLWGKERSNWSTTGVRQTTKQQQKREEELWPKTVVFFYLQCLYLDFYALFLVIILLFFVTLLCGLSVC